MPIGNGNRAVKFGELGVASGSTRGTACASSDVKIVLRGRRRLVSADVRRLRPCVWICGPHEFSLASLDPLQGFSG